MPSKLSWMPITDLLEYETIDEDRFYNELRPGDRKKYRSALFGVLDLCARDEQYSSVFLSLGQHGFKRPIHIFKRTIMDGHHRLAAAIELGYTHVPVKNTAALAIDSWEEDTWLGKVSSKKTLVMT